MRCFVIGICNVSYTNRKLVWSTCWHDRDDDLGLDFILVLHCFFQFHIYIYQIIEGLKY